MVTRSTTKLLRSALAFGALALVPAAPAAAQQSGLSRHVLPRVVVTRGAQGPVVRTPQIVTELMETRHRQVSDAKSSVVTLDYPVGVTLDARGNVLVANLFGGVTIYSETNHALLSTITAGLINPAAVAVNFERNIYVANFSTNSITIYNPSYQQIGTINDASLSSPTQLYIDQDDDIWCLDSNGLLHLYLGDGTAIGSTRTGGTALGPWGPYFTVWGVSNTSGGYDELVGMRGRSLHFGVGVSGYYPDGSPEAGGEAEDAAGDQYVTDYAHNQVVIFDPTGSFELGVINVPSAPAGIAVDNKHGRIYVTLPTVNQVVAYSITAPYALRFTIH